MLPFTIRTRGLSLSSRDQALSERYLRLALGREPFRISAVSLYLRPARIAGNEVELAARLVIRSPLFRHITIRDCDTKLSRLLVNLVRRAQYIGRRRHQRKVSLMRQTGDRFSMADR